LPGGCYTLKPRDTVEVALLVSYDTGGIAYRRDMFDLVVYMHLHSLDKCLTQISLAAHCRYTVPTGCNSVFTSRGCG
jgi:hypothetical protein